MYAKMGKTIASASVTRANMKSVISVPDSKLVVLREYHIEMHVTRYVCIRARRTELNISFCCMIKNSF